ncbi:MAG: hypothetical protein IKF19_04175 [Bacilli bacterium]|nr:hypothetical protein [Bacilli bacterium]
MTKTKCNNIHKYGPFKKNDNSFYRECLKCNKKATYPIYEEIEKEYNNQKITNYIIEIIIKKKVTNIQNSSYFFRLILSLLDNISYTYLSNSNQNKILKSIQELNIYFNKKDKNKLTLIKQSINYLEKYFNNYNKELENNYDENILDSLDKNYLILMTKLHIELENIIKNEENTLVTIDSNYNSKNTTISINLNEAENESD